MQVRLRAESLTCRSTSHLLLWFESNGSHRHMRVTLTESAELRAGRRELRARLNAARRALNAADRARLSLAVARHADRARLLRSGARIAAYAALPRELDAGPLIGLAMRRGCRVYLPRIDPQRSSRAMSFVPMEGPWRRNWLGIDEPAAAGTTLGARWLDLVFVPLVGFDRRGARLGGGGGFYDRAFAFRQDRSSWHAPRLIGLAYGFQEVGELAVAHHDVHLDAVITETGIIECATG